MNNTPYAPLEDGFYPVLADMVRLRPWRDFTSFTDADARRALARDRLAPRDLLALLSPAAEFLLEAMARKARDVTLRQSGRVVQLFTPLYLANFCTNRCLYCGFNARRRIARHMLRLVDVEEEARAIADTGLRRVLALTGDAPAKTGVEYLAECAAVLACYFSSVGIEAPSMTVAEYARMVAAGVDSMTMFQETYDEALYRHLHPSGPKRDFAFRLDAPQRAAMGGIRAVNLGPLLGLGDWRRDVFLTTMHAEFLLRRYPHLEVSISLPRMRPCGEKPDSPEEQAFSPCVVSDGNFTQALTAFRCFLPQAGITLSTREPAVLRDRLIPLGVTRVSAGVSTAVGGHSAQKSGGDGVPQFDISDPRSVPEMAEAIERLGYQPVYADWLLCGDGTARLTQGISAALGHRAAP